MRNVLFFLEEKKDLKTIFKKLQKKKNHCYVINSGNANAGKQLDDRHVWRSMFIDVLVLAGLKIIRFTFILNLIFQINSLILKQRQCSNLLEFNGEFKLTNKYIDLIYCINKNKKVPKTKNGMNKKKLAWYKQTINIFIWSSTASLIILPNTRAQAGRSR